MADLDGDGHEDLISGGWRAVVYRWPDRQLRGFSKREVLVARADTPKDDPYAGYEYGELQAGAVATGDLDADGDTDLVVGTVFGRIYVVANEGTRSAPKFGKPTVFVDGRIDPRFPKRFSKAGPVLADWDGDGDLDFIVGSESTGVLLLSNVGTAEKPKLGRAVTLHEGSAFIEDGCRFKPTVADWTGDGRLDLVIGECRFKMTNAGFGTHGYVLVRLGNGK
ncbi:MAG: hypothetical protein CMJ83_05080 [Planctomycetes bacterium]|nr:hypothetical protein [Planctomycetota bacterium]